MLRRGALGRLTGLGSAEPRSPLASGAWGTGGWDRACNVRVGAGLGPSRRLRVLFARKTNSGKKGHTM